MKILVLGGNGFLGSHFVDKVVDLGHEVTVFDRVQPRVARNLEHLWGRIRFINGEFENRKVLREALEGQDIVYHFIGATYPLASWKDPFIEIDLTIRSSVSMFDIAVEEGVKKIVYPSSGGTVYGRQKSPFTEETPTQPFSPYGIAKLATEHFLSYYREANGVAADVYRIGNPYGPRQAIGSVQGVINVWMEAVLQGKEFLVFGDESNIRDYIYVGDVAHLMTHSLTDLGSSDTFNLGSGQGVSILELLEVFKEALDGEDLKYQVLPRRPSDNVASVLDTSKLLAHFPGFEFQDLAEKVLETWEDLKTRYTR